MLFPEPTPAQPARLRTELAPGTLRTIPSHLSGSTPSGQHQPHHHQRRSSTQQQQQHGSVSPYQNPRVRNSLQSPVSSTSSPRFSPTGQHQQHQFYASSAPASSTTLEHQQSPRSRPPVPLFPSDSTSNLPMYNDSPAISLMDSPTGMVHPRHHHSFMSRLTSFDTTDEELGFSLDQYLVSGDEHAVDFTLFGSSNHNMDFEHSAFEPINLSSSAQPTTVPQTVSPKDVLIDSISAPPSSAITNLSTPGTNYMESPYYAMSANTSPAYGDDFLPEDSNDWSPLFPTDTNHAHPSTNESVDLNPKTEVLIAPPMSRNQSSPGQSSSRGSHQGRHSSISGVGSRKRDKPLPPITVDDPNDTVAVKRARNTAAARKSRQKKMERFEEMEATIQELQGEVAKWKSIALRQRMDRS